MPFISELIGRPVVDVDGQMVGRLNDLVAVLRENLPHPRIEALEVKSGRQLLLVPYQDVMMLFIPAIPLKKKREEIQPYTPEAHALYLVRDVLDKQIIDINGVRVVRVNDLELSRVNEQVYVANVDASSGGLIRRLGMGRLAPQRSQPSKEPRPGMIPWDSVELLDKEQPMRLKVPGQKMSELHPADLAEILSDLNRQESSTLLETLDVKTLADTLEEVEPDFQANLVEQMPDEKVADVLEEMAPDEAADLLAELPEDRSEELLRLMEKDDAEDVRKLLAYPEDSAGGIMNTEFVIVRPGMTADEVMRHLRSTVSEEPETIYYIYVVDELEHLVGVFSLRNLVLSLPDTQVREFMEDRIISVDILESQEEVARLISKYNLLAIPVVDEEKRLHGIVTADDALDKIMPTAWKKRLPRLYR